MPISSNHNRKIGIWFVALHQIIASFIITNLIIKLSKHFLTHEIDEALIIANRIIVLGKNPAAITNEIILPEAQAERSLLYGETCYFSALITSSPCLTPFRLIKESASSIRSCAGPLTAMVSRQLS